MTKQQITINFESYASLDELSKEDHELCNAAIKAMNESSYAPYSKFNVGAAVRLSNGVIVPGANQENLAFPSGLCAERTAMFAASAQYPNERMCTIALVGGQNGEICPSPATPCGACRQVMAEYQTKGGKNLAVIMIGANVIYRFEKVDDILPLIFDSLKF
ncbi:MAG: cytidine deaminase [Bacteroidales bacterium]|nr:cytidine deaminase [Bacteroidales bacterium]